MVARDEGEEVEDQDGQQPMRSSAAQREGGRAQQRGQQQRRRRKAPQVRSACLVADEEGQRQEQRAQRRPQVSGDQSSQRFSSSGVFIAVGARQAVRPRPCQ